MPVVSPKWIVGATRQEANGVFGDLQPIGATTSAIASLGAVVGLILAAFAKTLFPAAEVSYGEWIGYCGALAGLFALTVELARLAS